MSLENGPVGIVNLKLFLSFALECCSVAYDISASPKEASNLSRYFEALKLIPDGVSLLSVKWSELAKEFFDLDEKEQAEIKSFVSERFKISDKAIEAQIDNCFSLLIDLESGIKRALNIHQALH